MKSITPLKNSERFPVLVKALLVWMCLGVVPVAAQDFAPEVIGGNDATPGEYPWMVGLLYSDPADNFYAQFCGGVLVHPYYVLTAAHCVDGENRVSVEILVDTYDLDFGGRRIDVAEIISHPGYDDFSLDNDIALIRLATPVTDIEPIGIADEEAWQATGISARVIGWGIFTAEFEFPNFLQEGDVTIDAYAPANAAWGNTLTTRMLPATSPGGFTDTCDGDSGGPLLVRRPNDNAWVVAGITSFGFECSVVDPPGIYTRVYELRRYIYDIIYPDLADYFDRYGKASLYSDEDGDSLPVLEEFAFNVDPDSGDLFGLPRAGLTQVGDETYPTISFRRQRDMRSFEFYLEQASSPTGPWESFSIPPLSTMQTNIDSRTEEITVRGHRPNSTSPYLRLSLERTGSR